MSSWSAALELRCELPENQEEKVEVVRVHGLQGKTAQSNAESRSSNISSSVAVKRNNVFFVLTAERTTTTDIKFWQ